MAQADIETLLDRAAALTGIVRAAWITMTLGCLYVWLTLASLHDIDLFLPQKTLTLPFVGTGISTEGFFVFAPALLLASFLYFQLMLARLWECYGDLIRAHKGPEGTDQSTKVGEMVAPWFLTVLIPHRKYGFDRLTKLIAFLFCWAFAPLTILALGYRYLRAHDYSLTIFHSLLAAILITMVCLFLIHRRRSVSKMETGKDNDLSVAVISFVVVFTLTIIMMANSYLLINFDFLPDQTPRFLSPHAQLYRAKLSARPANWDSLRWQKINAAIDHLRMCQGDENREACQDPGDSSEQAAIELGRLLEEREMRRSMITGAELGLIPHAQSAETDFGQNTTYDCETADRIEPPRDLRFAYLVEAYIVNANLHCADFRSADLREANLQGSKLSFADMRGAILRHAKMQGADLRHARVSGADLRYAEMQGANLQSAKLHDKANLHDKAKLQYARLAGADLQYAELYEADFSSAEMRGGNLSYAKMSGTVFQDAGLTAADLKGAEMQGARLVSARLSGAQLLWTRLQGADLSGAILEGTVLWGTHFDAASNLKVSTLAGAALRHVDLSMTNVPEAALAGAFGDASVTLPEGVAPPGHWPTELIVDGAEFYNRWQGWRIACKLAAEPPGDALNWIKDAYKPTSWDSGAHGEPNCPRDPFSTAPAPAR